MVTLFLKVLVKQYLTNSAKVIRELHRVDRYIVWIAVLSSILLSMWAHYADDVINYDGIEYVRVAEEIAQGEWRYAMQTYKWPFYSGLVALTSLISGIPAENAAHLINALCYALLAVSFVAVVNVLGGGRSVLWIALLIFLLHPAINKFRSFIIRDPGFLAFTFAGLYGFFFYLKGGGKRHNLAAACCFVVAMLFRIEGVIFLVVSQILGLTNGSKRVISRRSSSALLVFVAMLLMLFLLWWSFQPTKELGREAIVQQPLLFLQTAWSQLGSGIAERLNEIENLLLVKYSTGYAVFVFLAVTFTILFAEVVNSAGVLYTFLAIYGWRYGLLFPRPGLLRPWVTFVAVSALFLYVFVFLQWFMTDRYPLAITLLLLLAAPFVLAYAYGRWWQNGTGARRALFGFLVVVLVFIGFKGLDLFTGKRYLKQAGVWLHDNLESGDKVFSNNRTILYYAGSQVEKAYRPYDEKWEGYKYTAWVEKNRHHYLAFRVKDSDRKPGDDLGVKLPHVLGRKPVVVTEGPEGALVMIFKRPW